MFIGKAKKSGSVSLGLVSALLLSLVLVGCGDEETADTSTVEERVQKVGSVATNAPAVEEAPAATEAAPAATEAAAPAAEAAPAATETAAAPAATAAAPAAVDGKAVYGKACIACHLAGVANAPKLGDTAAWAPRIAKGMDSLMASAINGIPGTAMPARGTCAACTDEELKAAVLYMSGQ